MMFKVFISHPEQTTQSLELKERSLMIGKARECQIRLDGWRVSKNHARVYQTDAGIFIQDLGQFHGTYVNGARIQQYGPLLKTDNVNIGGYQIQIEYSSTDNVTPPLIDIPHTQNIQETLLQEAISSTGSAPITFHGWRTRIHEQLLETIDLRRRDILHMEDAALRQETEKLIREIIEREKNKPSADNPYVLGKVKERRQQSRRVQAKDYEKLVLDVLSEAVGLGPLEALLQDETITEIMVNRYDEIYLERKGKLERHHTTFTSNRAVLGVIERIVAPLGRRIDESSPMVDARLKDGSRVNAIIPPLAIKGPSVTIRKFSQKALTAEDLVGFGSISDAMAEFLSICVLHRKNMIISGGTGSGKTTLLNVLSNFIPKHERVITIEDAAELKLDHQNLVSLEARPANAEGRGQVAIRDLVKNALRMRPDRIVVGECRGGEALDMLQAMNTGHEGSLTTLHANSPRDALARLETLILMAGMDLPITAIREQITSAVDIIIQQGRLTDGQRVVTSISEITGIESGKIQLQELFKFEQVQRSAHGRIAGRFSGCNTTPHFYQTLREAGIALDIDIFSLDPSIAHTNNHPLGSSA
jgi:pilus assembly protein CpaF